MLPDEALALLRSHIAPLPLGDIAPTSGGFSHPSALLSLGGQRCVAKAAELPIKRADLRRESAVLALLRTSDMPVPAPLALIEDERWTLELLSFLPGENGIAAYAWPPAELAGLAQQLGALLAQAHRLPLADTPDASLDLGLRAAALRAALAALDLPPEPRQALMARVEHPAHSGSPACLTHGDAGLHNLLWDGRRAALLDWEWAGVGSPLRDLAWVRWTLRWRQAPQPIWQAVLRGYGDGPGAASADDEEALHQLALAHMAAILVGVAAIPSAAAEWLRRIRWTIEGHAARRSP